ncbi:MAG: cytochrome c1 [Gammaproteobacteria bacterium]|nr:cytochrome c1 [Sideroxydans sp.]MBU3904170.1 cytochrome c1 [Gammaproteobacteria bacterium]MBU4046048.1 cytochrome c1 [Gammaproteobacteria bacterium]MBU4150835.1 cytochrome c1 [Gammaproteobacteria bacterium]
MKAIKRVIVWAMLACMPVFAHASEGGVHLDKAPVNLQDQASLQRGAKLFTSRCLACHSASAMRYNRLNDIGMSDDQIRAELELPEDVKVGSTMQAAMDSNSAKMAYGVAPPDLSVIARSRSADWLYTYMRTFYADPSKASGWNNKAFPSVAMPFVLADMQGEQAMEDGHLVLKTPGSMSVAEYDAAITDLTNYLVFMSEPAILVRHQIGWIVLIFLSILLVLMYALKKEIWKDIH